MLTCSFTNSSISYLDQQELLLRKFKKKPYIKRIVYFHKGTTFAKYSYIQNDVYRVDGRVFFTPKYFYVVTYCSLIDKFSERESDEFMNSFKLY